jgi:hypothetical protein
MSALSRPVGNFMNQVFFRMNQKKALVSVLPQFIHSTFAQLNQSGLVVKYAKQIRLQS